MEETIILPEGLILGTIEEIEEEPILTNNTEEMIKQLGVYTTQISQDLPISVIQSFGIQRADLKDLNIGPLNEDQKKQLEDLLVDNSNLFAKDRELPGRTNIIKHKIFTGNAAPII